MSARDGLRGRLVLMGLSAQAADRAIDAYAHELAERQRAWALVPSVVVRVEVPELLDSIVRAAVGCAADLIDPEVLNSGEAGAVQRP